MGEDDASSAEIQALEGELRRAEDRERERVKKALSVPPEKRTNLEHSIIAYSPWGTASGCSSCGG